MPTDCNGRLFVLVKQYVKSAAGVCIWVKRPV